jgi:hypothetical protein
MNFFVNLLPTGEPPIQIQNSLDFLSTSFSQANQFIPMDTALTILGLILTYEAAILSFKFVNFALNKFRGSG